MKKLFWLSAISFFISSATILFMPLGSFEPDGNSQLAYSLAGVFWLFLIMGLAFTFPVGRRRKKDKGRRNLYGFTFFRFFSNKPTLFFDAMLIIGIIALVVSLFIIRTLPGWLTLAGTFATVFALEMHGLFNGKNYEWLYGRYGIRIKGKRSRVYNYADELLERLEME